MNRGQEKIDSRQEQLKQAMRCTCRGCGCQACGGLYWLSLADAIRWNMITEEEAISKGLLSPESGEISRGGRIADASKNDGSGGPSLNDSNRDPGAG